MQLLAQSYRGQITDAITGEPLVFVNLSIPGTSLGTTTDFEGFFELQAKVGDSIFISYVGYEDATWAIEETAFVEIELQPTTTLLTEVVVRPGENPAWRIIRKVLANRPNNDPSYLPGYSYRSYRKTIMQVDSTSPDEVWKQHRYYRKRPDRWQRDSLKRARFEHDMHLWLTETVSDQYFRAPQRYKENILSTESSMPNDITQGFNPIAFQPFGFYQPLLRLEFTQQNYVNPISEGTFKHYEFTLADTLARGQDTTFVIQFQPLAGKSFVALKGLLYINTAGYAIENVIAEPADPNQTLGFVIQQASAPVNGQWFPKELRTELLLKIQVGQRMVRYSFGNQVQITDPILTPPAEQVFNQYRVEVKGEEPMGKLRVEPLSERERNTYVNWDSLPDLRTARRILNGYNTIVQIIGSGLAGQGLVQVVVPDLLRTNNLEGLRLGLGLRTSPAFSKRIGLYGYGGYGFDDERWKYGGAIDLNLHQDRDMRVRLSYRHDLAVPGVQPLLQATNNAWQGFNAQQFGRDRFDEIDSWRAEVIMRPHLAWQVNPYIVYEERMPAYDYGFAQEGINSSFYRTRTAGMQLRWSPKEQLARSGDWEAILFPNYPIVNFLAERQEIEQSSFGWWRLRGQIQHEFRWKYLGVSQVNVQAGWLSEAVPYSYLFQAQGGNAFFINNTLQTAGLTEFTNQTFAFAFLTQRFGHLLGKPKTPYTRPELSLLQNLAWGRTDDINQHQGVAVQDLRHLFLESGIRVDNLVRIPYFNFAYIGLGGSVFYRWGAYHLPLLKDNFRFQITVMLSV